ncbi:RpoT [Pseudomonas putida DOT-T1E]|uniref:RpoT n=1 Tax=Pseudomonas putida (strain DOT-T1E) TaxID=1196325 RepID=I7C3E3_PSEPT|nr:RpoT [Pseudomonas putida DOT-T1E]
MNSPATPFDFHRCLLACAQGDRRALQALYDHEGARLLGVARRIARDDATAEDIVHDAIIRIWTRAASYDPAHLGKKAWPATASLCDCDTRPLLQALFLCKPTAHGYHASLIPSRDWHAEVVESPQGRSVPFRRSSGGSPRGESQRSLEAAAASGK